MPDDQLIAVTGVTGFVGGRVAARLSEAGARLPLVVRDAARAPQLPGAEVQEASGYGAGGGMREALQGAPSVLLIPATESADRVEQHNEPPDRQAGALPHRD